MEVFSVQQTCDGPTRDEWDCGGSFELGWFGRKVQELKGIGNWLPLSVLREFFVRKICHSTF